MSSLPYTYRPSRRSNAQRGGAHQSRLHPYTRPHNPPSSSSQDEPVIPGVESGDPLLNSSLDPENLSVVVQRCYTSIQANSRQLQKLQTEVAAVAGQVSALLSKFNEEDKGKFTLKSANLERPLRVAIAKVYVSSVTRDLKEEDLPNILVEVLGEHSSAKHKCEAAAVKARDFMTSFRSEERRRIYGRSNCSASKNKSTTILAEELMRYYQAPISHKDTYIRNLAVLRLYVQVNPDAEHNNNFFGGFRKWLKEMYSDLPTVQDLDEVMERDQSHDYTLYPITPSPDELKELLPEAEEEIECETHAETNDSYELEIEC